MPSHLQEFAYHEILRTGPSTAGSIWTYFADRLGNVVPGATREEQVAFVESALKQDSRLRAEDSRDERAGATFLIA